MKTTTATNKQDNEKMEKKIACEKTSSGKNRERTAATKVFSRIQGQTLTLSLAIPFFRSHLS
eukprot:scaffold1353_cov161-Amphora_coffeaeformis.AAC.22